MDRDQIFSAHPEKQGSLDKPVVLVMVMEVEVEVDPSLFSRLGHQFPWGNVFFAAGGRLELGAGAESCLYEDWAMIHTRSRVRAITITMILEIHQRLFPRSNPLYLTLHAHVCATIFAFQLQGLCWFWLLKWADFRSERVRRGKSPL